MLAFALLPAVHSLLPYELFAVYVAIGWCIRALMVPIVLRREFAPGAALAWLGIVFLHPYIGVILYMTVGETRLGRRRSDQHQALVKRSRPLRNHDAAPARQRPEMQRSYDPMVLTAERISGLPIVGGNDFDFLGAITTLVDRLVADINTAQADVHLLYFIFACDGSGGRVIEALDAAARRGVRCRLLVDAVGSRHFLRNQETKARLKAAGVRIAAALPVAPISRQLPRMDLRNHRKLAVIDDRIAYVGSHNLINADYGSKRAGPWVDLSARVTGPIVAQLATVFDEDWMFESGEQLTPPPLDHDDTSATMDRGVPAQIVPTGPSPPGDNFRRVLLAAVQCARQQITLTSPYFVPDEPTLVALMMAADRGVAVTLIVPQRPDHPFTAAAGRAHYDRLMQAGIAIWQYQPGLIHAKTTTVDDVFAVFGSANLDVRSFNLNFELSVLLYGREVTERLRTVQAKYLEDSKRIDPLMWARRSVVKQYAERAVSLLSPLL